MLVLKLRRGQSARIGADVVVTVVRADGPDALIVTIDVPPSLKITRRAAVPLHSVPNDNSTEPVKPCGSNSSGPSVSYDAGQAGRRIRRPTIAVYPRKAVMTDD